MILDYYRIFYYVAQYKSFSKAADVMGMSWDVNFLSVPIAEYS